MVVTEENDDDDDEEEEERDVWMAQQLMAGVVCVVCVVVGLWRRTMVLGAWRCCRAFRSAMRSAMGRGDGLCGRGDGAYEDAVVGRGVLGVAWPWGVGGCVAGAWAHALIDGWHWLCAVR